MSRKLIICLILALVSVSYSEVLISSWEDASGDGDIDWGSHNSIAVADPNHTGTYTFLETTGVTDGSYSLGVNQSGWGQSLTLVLDYAQRTQLGANDTIEFDISVPAGASTDSGWCELYEVVLNADGHSWAKINDGNNPAFQWGYWDNSPVQTQHFAFTYDNSGFPAEPGYCEIILALNSDGAHNQFYIDGAKLTPEPATIALLGLGGVLLRRRKR